MNLLSFQKFKRKKISPLGLIKIIIIILVSVYLIGEFLPFYLDRGDPSYYKYLETEHGLILKDYSKTFCKLIRIENASGENNKQIQSDDVCHSFFILK